ncbi:site-2 protease family protein [Pelagicoccus sp. SDUM812003]|uniref:site-2 protease family protein n=1 Tax=Pelagicoccus sp. SDUM812003 TaxID=3041267 RepID=UPI00280DAD06|nr:site-2 protease family protein [Pelagicoccus sp. SDUM812003]MDQ8203115.1 site-2 protease family protein [Pelagicoccus sp. SDUM812003]
MIRFSLFGIPISIHWMFWVLSAFLGGALDARGQEEWILVFTFMLAATFSILVHEFGHALAGLRLGAPRVQIMLHSLGGLARFEGAHFGRKGRILMTAAGPAASIGLAVLFYFIGQFVLVGGGEGRTYFQLVLQYFVGVVVMINIFWSIINLMPIMPLDGGQILLAALGPSRLKLSCIISFVTIGFLAVALWLSTRSFFNILVMLFLASHTWQVFKAADESR